MIYLDHNATTPIAPEVMLVMQKAMSDFWGNASSPHAYGRKAYAELEKARQTFAELLQVKPSEVFFTSGGTESNNLAILGAVELLPDGSEILVSSIEHASVFDAFQSIDKTRFTMEEIPVQKNGIINPADLEKMLSDKTKLVSVMHANNETGAIQPVQEIGEMVSDRKIIFHCDAVQSFGKIPVSINTIKAGLVSISSHKMYGPKGCGALIVKSGTKIKPRLIGGNQERLLRPGTENLPAILGFVFAAEMILKKGESEKIRLQELTNQLYGEINRLIPDISLNGELNNRISNTLNICFNKVDAESLVASLDQEGICVSFGAACSSGSQTPSRTLMEMGLSKENAQSSIRISLGRQNSETDIPIVVNALEKVIKRLRKK